MSNVKLAIRVRPFSERELKTDKERTSVVSVVDKNTVAITNVKVNASGAGDSRERVRRYYADFAFDSACAYQDPNYASQEKVFEDMGREVLRSVSSGSSACVLAYGQSATGKTHTMIGTDDQPGLIPRLCRALSDERIYEVTVSFLEIYNERVHDLLAGEAAVPCHSLPRRRGNARKDLRVREHPTRGPYVQNLRRVAVQDVDSLLALVTEGARRRRTAATRRNSSSSRSHALLELATPLATLHLADLAGSEKASWEGCGGGRQKEGANINKSLVALSNVISALVSGGIRGKFVPYRDSALTWLLKDCFTGGARTFIIATVSPSVTCYGESASTLRWAARARQLPVLRTTPTSVSATKAALQAQFSQLLAELARNHIHFTPESGGIFYDEAHWSLKVTSPERKNGAENYLEIGNIMNKLNSKTTEVQNSESTASSIASGSSEVIDNEDSKKSIKDEVSKEVDKLFGPSLERTRSGSDFEVVTPLRHKKRQYKSHEVLLGNDIITKNVSLTQSQERICETDISDRNKPIAVLYDNNQRSEIVASVTERLYTKLKKKEESAISKVESMVDRKIMEPLSELRICTNARQRLMDISQKALRNKRRIGIPAYTQTRKLVTRVRDQGIDIQCDLDTYMINKINAHTLQRDVSTETTPMTPRCKEVAVGSICSSLDFRDISTLTENKKIELKNSFTMTDIVKQSNRGTQTAQVPPPRSHRRGSAFTQYLYDDAVENDLRNYNDISPAINIQISQHYFTDSESFSSTENLDNCVERNQKIMSDTTPDLLTSHNNIDTSAHDAEESYDETERKVSVTELKDYHSVSSHDQLREQEEMYCDEFPDANDSLLPRVTADSLNIIKQDDFKNIILGRNENSYPYNIVLSPPKEKATTKRIVKFKNTDVATGGFLRGQFSCEQENNTKVTNISSSNESSAKACINSVYDPLGPSSDSTVSSKMESNSFIWNIGTGTKQIQKPKGEATDIYTPIYKNNTRSKRTQIYKEFLGLGKGRRIERTNYKLPLPSSKATSMSDTSTSDSMDNDESQIVFKQKRQFFEDKLRPRCNCHNQNMGRLDKKILNSCHRLESTVSGYENYLETCKNNLRGPVNETIKRTPTKYLQHLVQLRREVISGHCSSDDNMSHM